MYFADRILKPEIYQGFGSRAPYFEGWYYRAESRSGETVAVIPGISKGRSGSEAFIQLICSFLDETFYDSYPASRFVPSGNEMLFDLGGSSFSRNQIDLRIDRGVPVRGTVRFVDAHPYPGGKWGPGIMGPFSFLPFMECRHGVVTAQSRTAGSLEIGGRTVDFGDGWGYIEKDWGSSFPSAFIWMQTGHFQNSDASFMLSLAKVPVFGRHLRGLISFLYLGGKFYRFATYTGASARGYAQKGDDFCLFVESPGYRLGVWVQAARGNDLKAPGNGEMNRKIRECTNGHIAVELKDRSGRVCFRDEARNAAVERFGNTEELF